MSEPWAVAQINSPVRGEPAAGDAATWAVQSMDLTWSWGLQPATATLTYIGLAPRVGSEVTLRAGGHTFYGLARRVTGEVSSNGQRITVGFEDMRCLLQLDLVYGAFNRPETKLVNGRRQRRFWHVLPWDFASGKRTWTSTPYTARQMLDFCFGAPTVETAWERVYHGDLDWPVYNVDCSGGQRLGAVVQRLSDRLGLTLTLMGGRYRLVWARKGEDSTPDFPWNSDNRVIGETLTDNPTRVRVLGDRNVYQVLDVPMVADWPQAWNRFAWDPEEFSDWVYRLVEDPDAGVVYESLPGDTDHVTGTLKAKIHSMRLTVGEFATLMGELAGPDAVELWADRRKFQGRSRMDMPVWLYLRQVVFRCFRPGDDFMLNGIALPSLRLMNSSVVRLQHDVATGVMSLAADQDVPDGSGYAICQGYLVSQDLFASIRPDRFKIEDWVATQRLWQRAGYQVDDSGEGTPFIVFDQPIVTSPDLVSMQDGHAVLEANPLVAVPPVRAALTFEAEPFSYFLGVSGADEVLNEPGLCREQWLRFGSADPAVEVPYGDGETAAVKAAAIAAPALARLQVVSAGGWTTRGSNGQQLNGALDRVTLRLNPQSGLTEEVDFVSERRRAVFEPEREYERRQQIVHLFPAEAELRAQAEASLRQLVGLKQSPDVRQRITQSLLGLFGVTQLQPATVENPGSETLPVGAPVWKKPTEMTGGGATKTQAVLPSSTTAEHSEFCGVVVRNGEPAARSFWVQAGGHGLVRVKGPVEANDSLAQSPGNDYLVKAEEAMVSAGVVALQAFTDSAVHLCRVRFGGGGGGASAALRCFKVKEVFGDWLRCRSWDVETEVEGETDEYVLKPFELRQSDWDGVSVAIGSYTWTYTEFNTEGTERKATVAGPAEWTAFERQVVLPRYITTKTLIYAATVQGGTGYFRTPPGSEDPVELTLQEVSARAWARKYSQA